jgi:acyl-CoA reductase-like NAD-dependent aldehyde dehydrogenase
VRKFAKVYKNYINGQWRASAGAIIAEVHCPATQELVAQCPQTTEHEFNEAVAVASAKQKEWADVPISTKVRYMLKYQQLIKDN